VIFAVKYVSAMVFGGGILGSVPKIWGNPYLNSTTVLFDTSGQLIPNSVSILYSVCLQEQAHNLSCFFCIFTIG